MMIDKVKASETCDERADAIVRDIRDNHLPRVAEGLQVNYIDENQILVIYDHAVRARVLKETAQRIRGMPNGL